MSLPSRACCESWLAIYSGWRVRFVGGGPCSFMIHAAAGLGRTLAKMEVQMGSTSTLAALIRAWSLSAWEGLVTWSMASAHCVVCFETI